MTVLAERETYQRAPVGVDRAARRGQRGTIRRLRDVNDAEEEVKIS